jgi:hydroxypyruvate isomerase
MLDPISRREALQRLAGASAVMTAASFLSVPLAAAERQLSNPLKNHVRHSVCKWCYPDIPLENLCREAENIGLQSIELLEVADFPLLKQYGLVCAMVTGVPGGITKGLNRLAHHDAIVAFFEQVIPASAQAGFPNAICFSGNREGMSDEEGLEHCAAGLRRMVPLAEKHGVTVCMELLNSRINHPDYMADHTAWGVELCKRVGSERFKLLYDIYHMQIMEGDLIHTIRDAHPYIGHYHTGGVPGRHEIDASQEINYATVVEAIIATGYKGYIAQEFLPLNPDKLASLRAAVRICDV